VIVTEPTASGIADLKRIMATTRHFNLPTMVILNKADVYPEGAQELEAFCAQEGVELIARIPFDTTVTEAMVKGITITQFAGESAVGLALRAAWQRILQVLAIQ
jgi:MinD superfamily P-loop ATPase